MEDKELTGKQFAFAQEYVKNGRNASAAYRVAYPASAKWKDSAVWSKSSTLMAQGNVKERIAKLWGLRESAMLAETLYDARQLMRDLVDIATADPNELTAHRRVNCRHCHGVEFAYQWDDAMEFAKACADALDTNAVRARQKLKVRELPSDAGGYGFAHNKLPNANCPKCKGEGVANVFVPDTTKLSVKGRKLFAGVRQTRNGLEIMQHDQVKARELIGKMLGVFVDKYKEVDPNAAPEVEALPLDATEAARAYAKIMKDG